MRAKAAWLALATASVVACGLSVVGTEIATNEPSDGGTPPGTEAGVPPGDDGDSGVGLDGGHDAAPIPRDDAGCPTGRGPAMLRLFGSTSPALCIDQTEVSSKQYEPFIAEVDAGRAPAQLPECAANTSVVPLDPNTSMTPPLGGNDPVDRVDWCDAWLFCAWAGKHLCARRDGTSTYIASSDATNATIGEWYAACSQDGTSPSVPAVANLKSNAIAGRDADGQVAVDGPPPGGPTYPAGLLGHIVGNVEEWADGCDGTGSCVARGASEQSDPPTDCTTRVAHPRMDRHADLGFRCCAKPMP
ncbi:MAG TPA: SUMF1/EgtB/PvdO family nonheme iron enzyme [Labilithrix sp.]|jgi:formylglycine-generating enzyme required for sulfatase activity